MEETTIKGVVRGYAIFLVAIIAMMTFSGWMMYYEIGLPIGLVVVVLFFFPIALWLRRRWAAVSTAVLCAIFGLSFLALLLQLFYRGFFSPLFTAMFFPLRLLPPIVLLLVLLLLISASAAGIYFFGFNKDVKALFSPQPSNTPSVTEKKV